MNGINNLPSRSASKGRADQHPVQLEHPFRRIDPDDRSASLHLGPSGLPVKSLLFPTGTLMPSAREGPPNLPALKHQGGASIPFGVHPICPFLQRNWGAPFGKTP